MSHNTLLHSIVRPIVRLAAQTGITPNQITTARLLTGLGAAAAFAQGTRAWMDIGGVVFLMSLLLDRADGALARHTNQTSLSGHRYDLASDCIASTMAFIGLGVGVAATAGIAGLWAGLMAALGIGTLFFQLNVLKAATVSGRTIGRVTVDPDDAMVFVPVLIWCGAAWPMVIVAAVVTPLASFGVAFSVFPSSKQI